MESKNQLETILKKYPEILPLFSKLKAGRAFTFIELTKATGIEAPKLQKHLAELISKNIVRQRTNRKRNYFYIADKEVQTVLYSFKDTDLPQTQKVPSGMKYCRHCYRHLAGYVGVKFAEAMERKGYISPREHHYTITSKGKKWFIKFGLEETIWHEKDLSRLSKKCLDFSERKSHLGGKLGDALLQKMLTEKWLVHVPDSREIRLTDKGRNAFILNFELVFPEMTHQI